MAAVLIVDDEESARLLVRLCLELDGHRVVGELADGEQVLDRLDDLSPEVLVLDMMMPGVSGEQVLRSLEGWPGGERPCVVAYSASSAYLRRAEQLGADRTVLKSGDMAGLLAAVAAC